jgi:hypothetical protein
MGIEGLSVRTLFRLLSACSRARCYFRGMDEALIFGIDDLHKVSYCLRIMGLAVADKRQL